MRMSRCFTWVPIGWFRRTQVISELGLNYNVWGFYLEGVGRRGMGIGIKAGLTLKV